MMTGETIRTNVYIDAEAHAHMVQVAGQKGMGQYISRLILEDRDRVDRLSDMAAIMARLTAIEAKVAALEAK